MVEWRANKRFADNLCPRHQPHLCLRHQLHLCPRSQLPDDEDIDGPRNFGLPNFQPPDAATSLRIFYWMLCEASAATYRVTDGVKI